ncbi:hypothetical protein [Mesorhizobium sp. 1M-11]|uniref:hypothetical protein n=1 Tax=Mesorhizobium sp. 1M-11 TaxID=1529006 RepID=UPI000AB8E1D1|nr:hypothetical protein [Mesorhizobium sp. 1M-11]
MSIAAQRTDETGGQRTPAERRWWLRSLLALIVLIPAALAVMSYDSVREFLGNRDFFAKEVAWGSKARFGGSDWQLTDLRAALGRADIPPEVVPVLVDLTVTVGETDLQTLWLGCKVMLVDAAGRRWLPTAAVSFRQTDDAKTCISAIFSSARSGDVLKIRETFLVPKDATATIRPAIGVASERPTFLLFERPRD